jgi:hypothetical protein
MEDVKFTITKFDSEINIIHVQFAEGGWAQIQLVAPLPSNLEELKAIVRGYVAPVEALQGRTSDVDLSYINAVIGVEQECSRIRLADSENSHLAALKAAEDKFSQELNMRVREILIAEGVIK